MGRYGKREKVTLYYTARKSTTGLSDVTVTIYYPDGSEYRSSVSMSEIGTTGIYAYTFLSPPSETTLYAVMDSASLPLQKSQEIVVGRLERGGGLVQRTPAVILTKEEKEKLLNTVGNIEESVRKQTDERIMEALGKFRDEFSKLLVLANDEKNGAKEVVLSFNKTLSGVQKSLSQTKKELIQENKKTVALSEKGIQSAICGHAERVESLEEKVSMVEKHINDFSKLFIKSLSTRDLENLALEDSNEFN